MAMLIKNLNDLDFTIVANPHEHRIEYIIYDIEGYTKDKTKDIFDIPLWHRAGSPCHPDSVESLELAQPYLHGYVKWDGCSNWYFDEQDRCMLHGCSRSDIQRFGDVMAFCWDWAKELLPNFEE